MAAKGTAIPSSSTRVVRVILAVSKADSSWGSCAILAIEDDLIHQWLGRNEVLGWVLPALGTVAVVAFSHWAHRRRQGPVATIKSQEPGG